MGDGDPWRRRRPRRTRDQSSRFRRSRLLFRRRGRPPALAASPSGSGPATWSESSLSASPSASEASRATSARTSTSATVTSSFVWRRVVGDRRLAALRCAPASRGKQDAAPASPLRAVAVAVPDLVAAPDESRSSSASLARRPGSHGSRSAPWRLGGPATRHKQVGHVGGPEEPGPSRGVIRGSERGRRAGSGPS
jgi:hypothetical protein